MRAALFALAAAALLIACSGAGTSTPLAVRPPGSGAGPSCEVPQEKLTLVSPASGATGVPVTIGSVTFAAMYHHDALWLVAVDTSEIVPGGPLVVSNGTQTSAIPTLRHGVTYHVVVRTQCAADDDFGFFTTG